MIEVDSIRFDSIRFMLHGKIEVTVQYCIMKNKQHGPDFVIKKTE